MMTSNPSSQNAFVWIWLPGKTAPVVAGQLARDGDRLLFNYGRSYLRRTDAIPIYMPELPLQQGILPLANGMAMPSCIRDASPDAWGRRVVINRRLGQTGQATGDTRLDELTFLLESGSDRIGALDFQLSATDYVPRGGSNPTLNELLEAAERVEKGLPLPLALDQALLHGTSIGGARPKALIDTNGAKYIAKFSSSNDLYSVVKAEFIAMRLASLVGLDVAEVSLTRSANRDVLLIKRFDRLTTPTGWQRKAMVSALTLFGLDEMLARYTSYQDLAEIIRRRFARPAKNLKQLFARLVFNILCGNTDDHARNHAAFWNGATLSLTPAYDICPQGRTGNEASQAMLIYNDERLSRISTCLAAAHHFLLDQPQAIAIVEHQIQTIRAHWLTICEQADLSPIEQGFFWRRQFLNPFAFDDLIGDAARLKMLIRDIS